MTLDPDVEALLRRAVKESGLPFKRVLNQAVRDGLNLPLLRPSPPYRLKTRKMGFRPEVCLDQALSLAAALEDEEIIRKLNLRK